MDTQLKAHDPNKDFKEFLDKYDSKEIDREYFIKEMLDSTHKFYGYGYEQAVEDGTNKEENNKYQNRIKPWLIECFGNDVAYDKKERNARFLEEALELVQSLGCSEEEAQQLVAYVYNRPIGQPYQEVGGVMVTLAALCLVNDLDMHENGETELKRIWTKVDVIREKQSQKQKYTPDKYDQEKEPEKIEEEYVPQTLEEAVNYLLSKIPEDQKQLAKSWTKNEFIGNTHMFLGMNIRNNWKLWFNDNPLCLYFSSIDINHGDDRSGMILDSLYNTLVEKPIDIEGQVTRYKNHWKKAGYKDGIIPIPPTSEEYMKQHKK